MSTIARIAAGVSVLSAAAFCTPAVALECAPIEKGHRILTQQYSEAPIGRGVQGGRLVMLYSSRDGSTWTVTVTDPRQGVMCIVASGEGWAPLTFTLPGEPS